MIANDKSSLIEFPDKAEDEVSRIVLPPNTEGRYKGQCVLTLKKGSFEMESAFDDKPIEMINGLITNLYISIKAGEQGCNFTLAYTNPKKKF